MKARVLMVGLALVLSGCAFGVGGDKSGGDGPRVTLHVATSDQAGTAMAPALEHFAEVVDDESSGRLRVVVTYEVPGLRVPKYDQAVAELVRDGEFDLGLVPARSWDDLGVSSLRPLQHEARLPAPVIERG